MLRREVYVKFAEALGIYGSVKSAQTSGGFSGAQTPAQLSPLSPRLPRR